MFPSYRNQSVDLLTDWFLYDGNIGRNDNKIFELT